MFSSGCQETTQSADRVTIFQTNELSGALNFTDQIRRRMFTLYLQMHTYTAVIPDAVLTAAIAE